MKKILLPLLIIGAFIHLCFTATQSPPSFEGTIDFDVVADAPGMPPEAQAMMKNILFKVYIKNEKYKSEMDMGIVKINVFGSNTSEETLMHYDIMGQQRLVKQTAEDIKKEKGEIADPVIRYVNEAKQIAGYDCKKAIITRKIKDKEGKESSVEGVMWYTESLPSYGSMQHFKGLKGFPMDFNIKQSNMQLRMTARSVKKETVSDVSLEPPKDLKIETMEEFRQSMKGLMGQ